MQRQRLLCTDLDRTLLPNGQQTESEAAAAILRALVERDELTLAFVTGRHLELVQQAIDEYDLPVPDYILGDVGSSIYRANRQCTTQREFIRDATWDERLTSQWPETSLVKLKDMLAQFPNIEPQEPSKQSRFKLSFYLPVATDFRAFERKISERLDSEGIDANIILSIDTEANRGLLDLLPSAAGKLRAIEYLMEALGYDHADVLFAGDSGNDIDVFSSHIQSVMVSNAEAELRERAISGKWPACILARGLVLPEAWSLKWNSILRQSAMPGHVGTIRLNGNYRGGIIEGMFHYWPETRDWLPKGSSSSL